MRFPWRLVRGFDCFKCLHDGTQVGVAYDFVGGSGGWITLTEFDGYRLAGPAHLKQLFEDENSHDAQPAMSDKTPHRL